MGDDHVRIWTGDRFQLLEGSLSRFGWWLHIHIRMGGSARVRLLTFWNASRDLQKSFLHNWRFFFFSSSLTYCWVSFFVSEQHLLCRESRCVSVCVCVFVCVYTPKYFCVYFHEPIQIQRVLVCWHLYYVCQWIPGFKCWRLTVHGDDLHHHLQQYAYYIRWRSAAEGPFLRSKAGACAHMGLGVELCDTLLASHQGQGSGQGRQTTYRLG